MASALCPPRGPGTPRREKLSIYSAPSSLFSIAASAMSSSSSSATPRALQSLTAPPYPHPYLERQSFQKTSPRRPDFGETISPFGG
jgi:hypothetical protein